MVTTIKAKKKQIMNAVRDIRDTASKEGWVLTLDRDTNALFYSPEIIPDKTELFQVTDEYAVYLDEELKPKGVVVEYYDNNFIKHHKDFKKISEEVFGKDNQKIKMVDPQSKGKKQTPSVLFQALLEKTLVTEAIENSVVVG